MDSALFERDSSQFQEHRLRSLTTRSESFLCPGTGLPYGSLVGTTGRGFGALATGFWESRIHCDYVVSHS